MGDSIMRIFSRCSDILVANVNALLDRVENPEAMLGQIVREMEERLATARSYAASAIAAERRLGRELAQHRSAVEFWQDKARTAVSANRDDLARLALARKREHEALVRELESQHLTAVETSTQVRAALHDLEAALAAAHRRQRSLIARHRAAQARRELCRTGGARLGSDLTLGAKLHHWEERITQWEDEAAALMDVQKLEGVESAFARWEAETELDRELAALKKDEADKKTEQNPRSLA
jgi:phage shock protein A